MAADEALLRCAQERGTPQLIARFYGWDRPSVSMGYFLKYSAVRAACEGATRDVATPFLVRRPTGGGVVRHGQDMTYSLIFHQDWLPNDARDEAGSYRWVHGLLRDALISMPGFEGLNALPPPQGQGGKITDCFTQPSAYDLMLNGKKIAGAAQRRSKGWILHQGSVFSDVIARSLATKQSRLKIAMAFAGQQPIPRDLTPAEHQLASDLFTTRYDTDAWNQKF